MDCLRSQLQIVVEEPTALAESPILTKPLPDAESNEIEEIQKVHPFYLPWDGRKLIEAVQGYSFFPICPPPRG